MKYALIFVVLLLSACATSPNKGADDPAVRARAKAHAQLGAAYFSQGQMAVALEEFNDAVKIDPNYAQGYLGVGLVRAALGQDEMADAGFKRALQLDPESSEVHNNYGTFLCSRNRIDESIAEFMAAVKNPLYPTPEIAYLNAGICALKKRDTQGAELYLNKALQIRPNLRQAAYHLASIYYERGDLLPARKYLARAMRDIEATPEMLWLGVRIERVLGDKDAEASYSLLLRHKFPDSEQTKAMLAE